MPTKVQKRIYFTLDIFIIIPKATVGGTLTALLCILFQAQPSSFSKLTFWLPHKSYKRIQRIYNISRIKEFQIGQNQTCFAKTDKLKLLVINISLEILEKKRKMQIHVV
jgi:hypothetical protein